MKDTTKKDWPQEKNNKSRKKCFGSECRVAQHSEIAIAVEGCPQKVQNSRLAGCGKSKLGALQPKHFDIELFYARRRHSTIDNVQLPVSGAASAGGSSTSGDSSDR